MCVISIHKQMLFSTDFRKTSAIYFIIVHHNNESRHFNGEMLRNVLPADILSHYIYCGRQVNVRFRHAA